MSEEEKKKVAAMWQVPYSCDSCGGTIPLTCQTTVCVLCQKPVDGSAAMLAFWEVLCDERAWRRWQANHRKSEPSCVEKADFLAEKDD